MRRVLAKSLLVIFEAVIDEIAERINKRRRRNGNSDGLDRVRAGGSADDLRDQSAPRNPLVACGRGIRRWRERPIFKKGRLKRERSKQP